MAAVVALAVTSMVSCGSDEHSPPRTDIPKLPAVPPIEVGCESQSGADFPNAFGDQHNLVVGPLVMVGGRNFVPASDVKENGGAKYPLLIKAGRKVTVQIASDRNNAAALLYDHTGDREMSNGKSAITFSACRDSEDSQSSADGQPVTFWSGFVLVRGPMCVPLEITVDNESSTRSASLEIGRLCR